MLHRFMLLNEKLNPTLFNGFVDLIYFEPDAVQHAPPTIHPEIQTTLYAALSCGAFLCNGETIAIYKCMFSAWQIYLFAAFPPLSQRHVLAYIVHVHGVCSHAHQA